MTSRLLRSLLIPLLALFTGTYASTAVAETYYVSNEGNDTATGTSPDAPWRSLDRVSAQRYAPGDRVLFHAGEIFAGQLRIRSSGTAGQPLVFSRYGDGERPTIDGGASPDTQHVAAIVIWNQQHIEVRDLTIANDVRRTVHGEARDLSFGISLVNANAGVLEHFRFANLVISDIFAERIDHGNEEAFNRVGIAGIRISTIAGEGRSRPSYFRDIVIENSVFERSGRFGVRITHFGGHGKGERSAHNRDPETDFNRDIIIRGNRFAHMGGSAVQLAGARFALIEDNDFENTGSSLVPDRMVARGSGAWVINSRDIVAQHNRSHHIRGYKDSYGMHVDFGNRDILYQYNFSHDSEGGFVEILGNNRNIIWRYNISVNDGLREKAGNTLWISPFSPGRTPSDEIYIYNNSVFVRSGLYPDLDFRARGAHVWNNIFSVAPEAMIGESLRVELSGGQLDLRGNLFSGKVNPEFVALDSQAVAGDPRFVLPGSTAPEAYQLRTGSAAIGKGSNVAHPHFPAAGMGVFETISEIPGVDFFGTPLDGMQPTIGAAVTIAATP